MRSARLRPTVDLSPGHRLLRIRPGGAHSRGVVVERVRKLPASDAAVTEREIARGRPVRTMTSRELVTSADEATSPPPSTRPTPPRARPSRPSGTHFRYTVTSPPVSESLALRRRGAMRPARRPAPFVAAFRENVNVVRS